MLVEDAREDHMEEPYTRAGFTTTLYVTMSVSFCFPHTVAVSAFICVVLSLWVKPRQNHLQIESLGQVCQGHSWPCNYNASILSLIIENNTNCEMHKGIKAIIPKTYAHIKKYIGINMHQLLHDVKKPYTLTIKNVYYIIWYANNDVLN